MSFHPAIDDPSNIIPSTKESPSIKSDVIVRCCHFPRGSVKRRSTKLTSSSFIEQVHIIGDKRNCGEYSNCQTEAFIVIPKVLFNSMKGIPKDECNGEAGNAICIKINDLEINDYVIRGTHLEKNTALILPVLESKGSVSIDRTTGKLVFQSGNNFGSSPTITADCVLQEKDAPKKF